LAMPHTFDTLFQRCQTVFLVLTFNVRPVSCILLDPHFFHLKLLDIRGQLRHRSRPGIGPGPGDRCRRSWPHDADDRHPDWQNTTPHARCIEHADRLFPVVRSAGLGNGRCYPHRTRSGTGGPVVPRPPEPSFGGAGSGRDRFRPYRCPDNERFWKSMLYRLALRWCHWNPTGGWTNTLIFTTTVRTIEIESKLSGVDEKFRSSTWNFHSNKKTNWLTMVRWTVESVTLVRVEWEGVAAIASGTGNEWYPGRVSYPFYEMDCCWDMQLMV